jgi:uncharacterized membrane protein YhaH (DUF805 family)
MSEQLQKLTSGGGAPKRGFSAWIGGRANRKNYWIWMGPIVAILVLSGLLGIPGLELVFGLPMLFVWIRRLHDLGRTGWWAPLINVVIGIVGWLETGVTSPGGEGGIGQGLFSLAALVILGALPGQGRSNVYGPQPGRRSELGETFA